MLQTLTDLILSALLVTLLVVLVTTASNLIWLSSMNMPINFALISSTFISDVIGMNFKSQIPLYLLVSLPLVLFLYVTKLSSKWIFSNLIYLYSFAGAISMLGLMTLLPLALDNLEPISGSRTNIGKLCMTICGFLGGYFFGSRQIKRGNSESQ
ncbi:hypothetical protein OAP03_00965 [Gammaproteobacteria bacterium]|nr:hypothetical protein [Gammaproteobacteria bacterium]